MFRVLIILTASAVVSYMLCAHALDCVGWNDVYREPKLAKHSLVARRSVGDVWTQHVTISPSGADRKALLIDMARGLNVLHVGCTDWPIFDPNNNLHMSLAGVAAALDCLDADVQGMRDIEKLLKRGNFYCDAAQIYIHANKHYDLVLVPEVIEHVPNIELLLRDLEKINFTTIVITAPTPNPTNWKMEGNVFIETIHPDHKAWFSPYTLVNVVEQYTSLIVTKALYWPHQMSCAVVAKKNHRH